MAEVVMMDEPSEPEPRYGIVVEIPDDIGTQASYDRCMKACYEAGLAVAMKKNRECIELFLGTTEPSGEAR